MPLSDVLCGSQYQLGFGWCHWACEQWNLDLPKLGILFYFHPFLCNFAQGFILMCRICNAEKVRFLRKRNEMNPCGCHCVDATRLFNILFFSSTSVIPFYCRIFGWIRFTRPNGRMGRDSVSCTGDICTCGPSQHWRVGVWKDRIYVLPRDLKNFLSCILNSVLLLFLVQSDAPLFGIYSN